MKKLFAIVLTLAMVLCLAACKKNDPQTDPKEDPKDNPPAEEQVDPNKKQATSMSYADFQKAAMDSDVVIEGFITAKSYAQAYGNCNLMIQDGDGAYYVYRMPCTDADNEKLAIGQKVVVKGVKTEWSGEVELKEGLSTYEIVEGKYEFSPVDVTDKLASEDLIKYQNMKVSIKGAEISKEPMYNWDGSGAEGDDIYFSFKVNGNEYTFLVETDLCAKDSATYKAAQALKVGDKVNMEGLLYWYNGAQAWITTISK